MKKLVILVMAGLLLGFGASLAFANPQVDGSVADQANSGNTADASTSSGSAATSVGDVANDGSSLYNKETKIWGNTKTTTIDKSGQTNDSGNSKTVTVNKTFTKDSNNSKTITVDKSGQTNDSNNTKTITVDKSGQTNDSYNTKNYKSNNTFTKTKYDVEAKKGAAASATGNANNVEAEKGSAASGNGNAWNVEVDLEQYTKYGSAASFSGDATVNKNSNNTKTYNKTYTKTVTIDKSGQTNTKQSIDDTKEGSAAAINGDATVNNTKTSTKTVTIDKSGQNNSKTKNYYTYKVDNQDLDASITGITNTDPSCCPTPEITQTVNKTFAATNSGSFNNINGVINNNNSAGHFNNNYAYTNFTINGNVASP